MWYAGAPHGFVLSPTLFLLRNNDMHALGNIAMQTTVQFMGDILVCFADVEEKQDLVDEIDLVLSRVSQ